MKIYTSYFANLKKIPSGIIPVSIALFKPKWYNGFEFKKLAPSYATFKTENLNEYTKLYKMCLSRLDPYEIQAELKNLSLGKDVALLCYEKPEDFCHRFLVAEWLSKNLFIEVKELMMPKVEQTSLF